MFDMTIPHQTIFKGFIDSSVRMTGSHRSTRSRGRVTYRFATFVLLLFVMPPSCVFSDEPVSVPDANLRAAVYEAAKKDPAEGDKVAKEILTGLYFLNASNRKIKDLTGLEHCINLGETRFTDNDIRDVTPLGACRNLQSLDLAGNQIVDVSALGAIQKLQYLKIEGNQVESLEGLETLSSLNCLYAAHNRIKDIAPVSGMKKLWTLDLNHNQIQNIAPVASLPRIDTLGLAHNRISDLSTLPPGNTVYTTYLHSNEITDLAPLVELAEQDASGPKRFVSFWKLYLAENPLNETSINQHLPRLRELGVRLNMEYKR